MSNAAVAVKAKSQATRSWAVSPAHLVLGLCLAFVLAARLVLHLWMPQPSGAFDTLYDAAGRLLRGEDVYPLGTAGFPYPLPAILLAVPFTAIPLGVARLAFDLLVGWMFVFALWRYRDRYALLAVLSGSYLFALANAQTTPLMLAASLIPALGFLLAVRPNTSAPLWIARPSWTAILGAGLFVMLSLAVLPTWPRDWWMALPPDNTAFLPPVMRPFGLVLLLAALGWRSAEGRLILALAFVPQTVLPYELIPLALVPSNRREMAVYLAGTWIAVAVTVHALGRGGVEIPAVAWPVMLCAGYVPMLYLVLRREIGKKRRKASPQLLKDRRRPNRLADEELKVDITAKGAHAVSVRVTHLPTKLSATDSGPSREQAERKAQDKLAALVAERLRQK